VNSWKAILATMVIFGTGVITGGLVVRHAAGPLKNRPPKNVTVRTNAPNIAPAQLQRMELLLRVRSELNLTPDQHERIERIIREGQERSRKLWESVAPEMRQELQAVHEQIRAELTPEQRRRFEQLLRSAPRPNPPDGGQPPNSERMRERMRQGERPLDGSFRPQRRDAPPNGPRPEGEPEPLPPADPPPEGDRPAPPAEPR